MNPKRFLEYFYIFLIFLVSCFIWIFISILNLFFIFLPHSGPLEVFSGGPRKTPEKILCQERALELPHPHLPGDGPQRRQLRGSRPEDPPQLGAGDRRSPLPGRRPQGAAAAEDQTAHLLRWPDVPHWGGPGNGNHIGARPLRDRTEVPQGETHRGGWEKRVIPGNERYCTGSHVLQVQWPKDSFKLIYLNAAPTGGFNYWESTDLQNTPKDAKEKEKKKVSL